MKKGCLFLLFVFAASWVGYWYYLKPTILADKWWVPGLLALSVLLVVSNLLGIYMAIRQKIASTKAPGQWRDGQLVGLSGAVSTSRPFSAPFSGKSAAIVEYEISRTEHHGDNNTSKTKECFGFIMAPTTIQSMRGSVRLVGFPLLAQVTPSIVTEEQGYQNAAEFLIKTKFTPEPKNPLKILSEINAVLADDDGIVDAHFGHVTLRDSVLAGTAGDDDFDRITDTDDGIDEVEEALPAEPPPVDEGAAKTLADKLSTRSYDLSETLIEPGTTVTVFGTYRASKQAIDIGSGLKNLNHTLQRGTIEKVLAKSFRKSLFGSIFWIAVAAAGHYYVAKLLGLLPA